MKVKPLVQVQDKLIADTFVGCSGVIADAARKLRCSRDTIYKSLKRQEMIIITRKVHNAARMAALWLAILLAGCASPEVKPLRKTPPMPRNTNASRALSVNAVPIPAKTNFTFKLWTLEKYGDYSRPDKIIEEYVIENSADLKTWTRLMVTNSEIISLPTSEPMMFFRAYGRLTNRMAWDTSTRSFITYQQ